ncbi:MAG: helix-turn-helix transcriptional regulator [Caulobacterales bacterium]
MHKIFCGDLTRCVTCMPIEPPANEHSSPSGDEAARLAPWRDLGRSLRTWRLLRRVKQQHAAELVGVSQSTISRWENGAQRPSDEQAARLADLLAAKPDTASDRALLELVAGSAARVHLICDLSHRLLAASPARARDWRAPLQDLLGRSLWRYASAEIVDAERRLSDLGWYDQSPPAIQLTTQANRSAEVPIVAGRVRWTRLRLSDGSFARLVQLAETSD